MKNRLDITPKQQAIIRKILHKYLPSNTKIWVFGSRANGTAKKFSDLDLVVDMDKSLTLDILANLHEEFSESLLPYKVDIVDWNEISDSFKKIIEDQRIEFK